MNCHRFSPKNPTMAEGNRQQLEIKLLYNSSDLSTIQYNDAAVMIQLINSSSVFSLDNHRMTTYLHPGKSYTLGLELFTYEDRSGSTHCIEQGQEDVLELFQGYSYFGCLEECRAKTELAACGCVAFYSLLNTGRTTQDNEKPFRLCSVLDYFFCAESKNAKNGKLPDFIMKASTNSERNSGMVFSPRKYLKPHLDG